MNRAGKSLARRSRRAGWLVPLGVFVVTAGFTAMALAYFQSGRGFNFFERPAPTDSTEPVALSIGETNFHIPASYMVYASARRGGDLNELEMIALLPDLQGYSLEGAQEFASKAPDSRVLNFTLREEKRTLSDQERLEQSYLPLVDNKDGASGPYGLTQYAFRANSGYEDKELFVGGTTSGTTILRCDKESAELPAPSCESMSQITDDLTLTYQYRRAHLAQWRDIEAGVRALSGAFMDLRPKGE